MRNLFFVVLIGMLIMGGWACSQSKPVSADRIIEVNCEDCHLMFEGMPEKLPWRTTLNKPEEPGERLILRGMVYKKDGKTPAPDVILYVYQTNSSGRYVPDKGQVHGRRHGHLRGWIKTDSQGRYEIETIRPGAYPGRSDPQHIHVYVKEPGLGVYWIDDFQFNDDPLLTPEKHAQQQNRGGSGILSIAKNSEGVWIGSRAIILGMNIPTY